TRTSPWPDRSRTSPCGGPRPAGRSKGRPTSSSRAASEEAAGMLQVGFGVGDVTPDVGMEMPGGFFKRKGTGVRDKLLASAGVGTGSAPGIAFNRRFLMRDGREVTHPGKPGTPHHADVVAPAGPTDPDVGVLAVRAPGARGKLAGVVVCFACHSTVVGGSEF